jgi:hypothetical protein
VDLRTLRGKKYKGVHLEWNAIQMEGNMPPVYQNEFFRLVAENNIA